MQQVEELSSSTAAMMSDGFLFKSEMIEQPTPSAVYVNDSAVAPPPVSQAQMVVQPIVSSEPTFKGPSKTPPKRKLRVPIHHTKINRSTSKPATLLARPSTSNVSTILPHPPKPILLANPITPLVSKPIPTIQTEAAKPITTYLVVDGNQGQFVQVTNDGQQPVTFRNQTGQILQATPINVVSAPSAQTGNTQSNIPTFPINSDCSLLSNSSQTVTTVRTSSSIDLQQQTMLTSDTTTMTTQQLRGIIHPPTNSFVSRTITNGNHVQAYEKNGSADGGLSLAQIVQKVNQPRRRSSSSSVSKKKRGRPRLYERDPFTNKPKKSHATPEKAEVPARTLTTAAVLIPKTNNNFHNLQPAAPSYNSIIFPRQTTTIPMMNTSLLQAPQYSYPSLLNNPNPSTNNAFVGSNFSIYSTPANPPIFSYSSSPTVFSHPPAAEPKPMAPLKSLQIPAASTPVVPPSSSPRRSVNSDVAVHYIGGYVIRESSHPFSPRDKIEQKENPHLQCIVCRTVDSSERFFDRERPFCSQFCSVKFNEKSLAYDKPAFANEPRETLVSPPSNTDDQAAPAIDRGLPADPGKWTVFHVGEFVTRLTNASIREAFYESEIDGQALLLMTQEHLRDTLKIKLGPSLIIASEIAKLRERAKSFSS